MIDVRCAYVMSLNIKELGHPYTKLNKDFTTNKHYINSNVIGMKTTFERIHTLTNITKMAANDKLISHVEHRFLRFPR